MTLLADTLGPTELRRMRRSVVAVLLLTVLVVTTAVFLGSLRYFERQERLTAENRLSLYQRSLNEALRQHQHLPYILAQNKTIQSAFETADQSALNETLRDFARKAKLEAIYIMGRDGVVVASSNAGDAHSFVGQNYGFRPYFRSALAGERSDYFAIGATSGRPGYFVSEPLIGSLGSILGVVAIKLDISELQSSWETGSEHVLAANPEGIVVLASNPEWLYRTLAPLAENSLTTILNSRQFGSEALNPLDWNVQDGGRVRLGGASYVTASGSADWRGWTVYYLSSDAAVVRQTLVTTGLLSTLVAILIGFATYLRSQRIRAALEVSQRQRRELIEANNRLTAAQDELKRTSKLAALGQLAASVTHELGQPISALKNHLTAAEIGNEITSADTARNLRRLADRMEDITGQLKFFAKDGGADHRVVDMRTILNEAVGLVRHDIENGGIKFSMSGPDDQIFVSGQPTQLEQAMINLLRNAIQAVADTDDPKLDIQVGADNSNVDVTVVDNGPGLSGRTLEDLVEPFFSTKPSGVGMGLGLAITTEIVQAHGGRLQALDIGRGAAFKMTLPLATKGGL